MHDSVKDLRPPDCARVSGGGNSKHVRSAVAQHACNLRDGVGKVRNVFQDFARDHQVKTRVRKREASDVFTSRSVSAYSSKLAVRSKVTAAVSSRLPEH